VDRNRFRPRDKGAAKRRWNLDGFVFLYAGRYAPEKRLASIVRAFQSLRTEEATLVVAGLDSVEFAVGVETTGSPVVFVGALPHDRMSDLLNAADVVVLFSKREGVPSIALEALSSGVPVIATSTGALPSIIRPGETGFLVSSEEELVEAMRSALGAQLAPAEVVSASVARYGWSEVGPQLERVYAELSASRP
jgi:glycosyltransferase involved in cell wall biosynthesis